MKIIAHRGYWIDPAEKNTEVAFRRSIREGFGIETDIRDYCGELVVCHDVPAADAKPLSFDTFLDIYDQRADKDAALAINIKSDGLQEMLAQALRAHKLESYFTFDMSIPSLYFGYQRTGLRVFSSVNEFMKEPVAFERADGIWLDAYVDIWYEMEQVASYLGQGKDVCIVSPELHGRLYSPLWELIKRSGLWRQDGLSICTDLPIQAREFFV